MLACLLNSSVHSWPSGQDLMNRWTPLVETSDWEWVNWVFWFIPCFHSSIDSKRRKPLFAVVCWQTKCFTFVPQILLIEKRNSNCFLLFFDYMATLPSMFSFNFHFHGGSFDKLKSSEFYRVTVSRFLPIPLPKLLKLCADPFQASSSSCLAIIFPRILCGKLSQFLGCCLQAQELFN